MACTDNDTVPTEGMAHTADPLYMIAYTADPEPVLAGDTMLMLQITDASDEAAVLGATLDVEPWMPAMGHGIMGEVTLMEMADGMYHAEWAYPMTGPWEVTINVDSDAGVDDAVVDFEVR